MHVNMQKIQVYCMDLQCQARGRGGGGGGVYPQDFMVLHWRGNCTVQTAKPLNYVGGEGRGRGQNCLQKKKFENCRACSLKDEMTEVLFTTFEVHLFEELVLYVTNFVWLKKYFSTSLFTNDRDINDWVNFHLLVNRICPQEHSVLMECWTTLTPLKLSVHVTRRSW